VRAVSANVGDSCSVVLSVTDDHFAAASLFGPPNPIHVSDEHARARGLPGRILPGAIVAGIASSALADISPQDVELLSFETKFKASVFVDDELTVTCELMSKEPMLRGGELLRFAIQTSNQHGMLVAQSNAVVSTS
jgi:acyl dehydratase